MAVSVDVVAVLLTVMGVARSVVVGEDCSAAPVVGADAANKHTLVIKIDKQKTIIFSMMVFFEMFKKVY